MLLLEVAHVGERVEEAEACLKEQGPPQKGQFKKDDNNQRNGK